MLGDFGWLLGLLWCFWSMYIPSVSDQRLFLSWFLKNVVISFSIFCFGISALGLFYLSALLGCCLIVLVESWGGRFILLLYYLIFIQKIQKYLLLLHHYASLHVAFCMVLALGLLIEVLVRISYRNDCICHFKEIFHFT